jgi:hypothetical protein
MNRAEKKYLLKKTFTILKLNQSFNKFIRDEEDKMFESDCYLLEKYNYMIY